MSNAIFISWDRPVPGRETAANELLDEFGSYLAEQQKSGAVESFDAVLLRPHGSDLNGFFLIQGEPEKLDALLRGDEFVGLMLKAHANVLRARIVSGFHGEAVQAVRKRLRKLGPQ